VDDDEVGAQRILSDCIRQSESSGRLLVLRGE
jgi:hypothetical protein